MRRGGGLSGAVSLVMIFCVLCLSVFAVLTLSTAMNEKRLSDLATQRAAEYFAADCRAAEVLSELSAGKEPGDVEIARTETNEGTLVEFSLAAGGDRTLAVRAVLDGRGGYRVLCWKTGYSGDWETDDIIEIWDGV